MMVVSASFTIVLVSELCLSGTVRQLDLFKLCVKQKMQRHDVLPLSCHRINRQSKGSSMVVLVSQSL
jgi:hypothetical protein